MAYYPNQFDREQLLECAHGRLFGEGNAQLPEYPMLMIDRILDISADGGEFGKGHVLAEFDIHPNLWFFKCHFPNDPVMPGCLGLDALWQLTGFGLAWRGMLGRGRAIGTGSIKLTGMVTPQIGQLSYEVHFSKVIDRSKIKMGISNGIVKEDGEKIYEVSEMRVSLVHNAE